MNSEKDGAGANQTQLELKYCERCGGLWLRPVGGGQIYCAGCAGQMLQLPPASKVQETARMPQGPRWGTDDNEDVFHEAEDDADARKGVA